MNIYIYIYICMFFLNSWNPKNWENWLVLVLTGWNLEPLPSKYSKINVIYICTYIYIYIFIYIYIHVFSQLLESEKLGKLKSFGVDMCFVNSWNPKNVENWLALVLTCFFSQLLESKKWWKLTSFGVDMCFLNSWNPKNVDNWLVLVLTCFFLNSWNQKNGENWLV